MKPLYDSTQLNNILALLKPYKDAQGLDNNQELVRDLLCDLMHICYHFQLDFEDELRIARDNYKSETLTN